MKYLYSVALLILTLIFTLGAFADVEWQAERKLKVGDTPVDVALTSDGRTSYILTDKGTVLIYSENGTLKDKISVGNSYDGIEVSPKGDKLYLRSSKDKAVQIVSLEFIFDINTAGSPYKGEENAKVVVAVFSDFQ